MDTKIIVGAIVVISVLLNATVAVMVWAHRRVSNPDVKEVLEYVLKYCDKFCDTVEFPARRAKAIMGFQSILGLGIAGKRIYLPTVIVGWILDGEVAVLRWLNVPDLHQWTPNNNEEAQP
jgi:hypothetical protein